MNKVFLVGLFSVCCMDAAQAAGPTLYGGFNVSVDHVDSDLKSKKLWAIDSNGSYFGIRGDEALTDRLSAIYGIEWAIVLDNNLTSASVGVPNTGPFTVSGFASNGGKASNGGGTSTELAARNRFVGLQYSGIGALKIGRINTYVKTSQNGADIFDDMVDGSVDMTQTLAGENRINNVIAFESAKFDLQGMGQIQANLMMQSGEGSAVRSAQGCTDATTTSPCNSNGLADGLSGSMIYNNLRYGLYAAAAFDHNIVSGWNAFGTFNTPIAANQLQTVSLGSTNLGDKTDIIRLVGSIDLSKLGVEGLTIKGLYQRATRAQKFDGTLATVNASSGRITAVGIDPKETAYVVNAAYKFPDSSWLKNVVAKVQWQQSTTDFHQANQGSDSLSDVKIEQIGADIDYEFSSKTKAYLFYAKREIKNPNNPSVVESGQDQNYAYAAYGVGLLQRF